MPTQLTPAELRNFEATVLPLLPVLRARARRLCGRRESEVSDLLQDCLERALRSFPRFQNGSNPMAWLGTIMLNQFIDRRRKVARQLPTQLLDESTIEAPAPDPEPLSARFTATHVRGALDRLHPTFRQIGTLHFFDGCSQREISERLNIPLGTVGTRVMRTKRKLRALLAAPDESPDTIAAA
jgi:RNA polymerase sigma-70 factor (ECF subfamily)